MIAVAVVLGATITAYTADLTSDTQPTAPAIEASDDPVAALDDGERAVVITLTAGDAVRTSHLYVVGSKPLDVGGRPGESSTPANDEYASRREKFTESSGDNPPQVGIGDTWEAGETVYVDPERSVDGVTISIYWTSDPVEGINPGTPRGDAAYELVTVEIGSTTQLRPGDAGVTPTFNPVASLPRV
ncbi:type IV pilin [Halobellus sp. MBLA0160]|uniref:Type IV pilin n=2 Tax=Halobellus ruber TaxID=2761102 RepID=A0A7J9SIX4_9EURY|nr:type IV pilin [Halobellus ruber]